MEMLSVGIPLTRSRWLTIRPDLIDLVASSKVYQIMGEIRETTDGTFWFPLWLSIAELEPQETCFPLWDAEQDTKLMPEVTCGIAQHTVILESGVEKTNLRQILGEELPKICVSKMMTSIHDLWLNREAVESIVEPDASWWKIADYPKLKQIVQSLRLSL